MTTPREKYWVDNGTLWFRLQAVGKEREAPLMLGEWFVSKGLDGTERKTMWWLDDAGNLKTRQLYLISGDDYVTAEYTRLIPHNGTMLQLCSVEGLSGNYVNTSRTWTRVDE